MIALSVAIGCYPDGIPTSRSRKLRCSLFLCSLSVPIGSSS